MFWARLSTVFRGCAFGAVAAKGGPACRGAYVWGFRAWAGCRLAKTRL